MKKLYFILGLAILVALVASCAGGNSPSSVVQKFFTALEKNDTKALEAVATTETVQLIAMVGEKAGTMATENGKIKSMTETIDGDTAVVVVTFDNGETSDIDLVKVDGKWKVTMSK
jgi:ketosteroid isomerase-like protein